MNEKCTCDELCRELHRKVLTSDTYVCMVQVLELAIREMQ